MVRVAFPGITAQKIVSTSWDCGSISPRYVLLKMKAGNPVQTNPAYDAWNPGKQLAKWEYYRDTFPAGRITLTHIAHLWHSGMVRTLQKDRWVVIDVLNFDNEFRRWLQRPVRGPVHGLSQQRILGFLLPVQCFSDMNIARLLINHKDRACSLTGQHVLDAAFPTVHVCVKLSVKKSAVIEKQATPREFYRAKGMLGGSRRGGRTSGGDWPRYPNVNCYWLICSDIRTSIHVFCMRRRHTIRDKTLTLLFPIPFGLDCSIRGLCFTGVGARMRLTTVACLNDFAAEVNFQPGTS